MDKKTTLMLVTLGLALSSVPVYADQSAPATTTPAPQTGSHTGEKHPNMMHEDRHKMEEDRRKMMEERRKMEEEREMREKRGHGQGNQPHNDRQGGQQHGSQSTGTTTTTPAPAAAN